MPTTPYYLGFADLSAGPLVLEMPARGVQGAINDSWQNAIPGTEAPGKYLVLAPGQQAPGSVDGFIVRHSPTFNVFLGVRLTDADPEGAKEALSQLRMYPYAVRDNPPKMDILDAGTKAWSGLPPRGMEYWQRVNDVIQAEPIETRDIFFHDMLRPLGLEKSKPFRPDARQAKILTDAALVGEAMAKANSADRRFKDGKYRSDAHWDFALLLDADAPDSFWNLLDERASWFYEAVAGDRVVVRGEVTGTPAGELFGVPHSGKSFRIMAVDIQTIRDGKIAQTFHMENWLSAIGQLRAK